MDFKPVLANLCLKVEALAPGSIAGITLCDKAGSSVDLGIFPSLPAVFSDAIHAIALEPPFFGSCVRAIATGEVVTSVDVANDMRFDPRWRELCTEHGLRALQSRPIVVNGRAVGTFVLGWPEPRDETVWDVALMQFAADAAAEQLTGFGLVQQEAPASLA